MTATRITYKRPAVTDYQLRDLFGDYRTSVIEATTKAGKTVGCSIWLHEEALAGREGDNYWWVAPVYGQARIAFDRMLRFLKLARRNEDGSLTKLTTRTLYRWTESPMVITCPNGARIWFKTAEKPDNLYGEDVRACVRDEASRMRDEAHYALRSTLTATKGKDRWIGNVKGRRNEHYKMARRGQAEEDGIHYALWTWRDAVAAGILDKDEIDAARRDLPEAVFAELYEGIPSDDGGNPFGLSHIDAAKIALNEKAEPFVWGWDLAKSNDYLVGIALDETGAPCRFVRERPQSWERAQRLILERATVYSLCDSTGAGDPIVESMRAKKSTVHGYHFSSTTKQQLMESLAWCVQSTHPDKALAAKGRRVVGIPDNKVMLAEMDVFEWEHTRTGVRYAAPEGYHDDTVCSLALAAWAWRHRMRGRIPNLPPLHWN